MRVMLDTNVLVSAFVFQSQQMNAMVDALTGEHTIVLCSYVIAELKMVVAEKFSHKRASLDRFLADLPFEFVYTPDILDEEQYPVLRDREDLPVLATAILADVDILLTGDKDFENLGLERRLIVTPAGFLKIIEK